MGTINEYIVRHGLAGLAELADRAGTSVGYLKQLNYNSTRKRPSMEMARRLVEASGGELTYDGLANPRFRRVYEARREIHDQVKV